ncbi:MAG: hypothetical protein ACLFU8_08300 [Anaerolineales bacterium]
MKRRKLLFLVLAAVLGLGALLALQIVVGGVISRAAWENRPTLSPTDAFFADVALELGDLPQGWRRGGVMVESVPNAEGRFYRFYGTANRSESWINVGQIILLYPDVAAARVGYQEQDRQYIPPTATQWREMEELAFAHQADEWHAECLPHSINGSPGFGCRAIARYENLVIVMLGNVFEERWLSMADFRTVLEAMDRRATAALEGD